MISAYNILDPMALGWQSGWEPPDLRTMCEFAQTHFKLPGSAINESQTFDPRETPWVVDVVNDAMPGGHVRYNTFVKPVQIGGSVAGEVVLMNWLARLKYGDIQYNWESNDKAKDRWKKRFEKLLRASEIILNLLPDDNTKYQTCLIILDRLNFTMQGVESDRNLASDSVAAQVNEEIHDWDPGKLALAYGRTTAYQATWFHIVNISNASMIGDQLHKAMVNGTNREWTVKCPGCGLYHAMRTEWDKTEPQLGGLRYDSDGCKRDDGSYDYNRLAGTIYNQMPCGYRLHRLADRAQDLKIRKALSQTGKYSDPRNTGAHLNNESRTLEAVSAHYIDALILIMEKHDALRALRYGDPEPWSRYKRERECLFVDPEDRPLVHDIVLSSAVKKDRDGLAGRTHRFFALDRQRGQVSKGEHKHWWLLIVDFGVINGKLTLQVVFEGKILTDEDVIDTLDRHDIKPGVNRHFGLADSTWDSLTVQAFCLRHGINAVCATGAAHFAHENGKKRVFSPEKPLHANMGAPSLFPAVKHRDSKGVTLLPDRREPLFWFYSKAGIMDRLHYLRTAPEVEIIIPGDVSKDFKNHMESFICEPKKQTDGSIVMEWRQVRERADLFVCFCYVAMLLDMAGQIGAAAGTALKSSIVKESTQEEVKS